MTRRIAVFCSGSGSNFEAIVRAIQSGKLNAEPALMFCDKPGAYAVWRANKLGVPAVVLPSKLFSSRQDHERMAIRILKSQRVDLVVLAGYMRILTPVFIRAYRNRILNIHPSLLPAFKGAHAIRDAYEAGVAETGVSVHVVTLKLDSGPILEQAVVRRRPSDTLESLEKNIHKAEHVLYPKAIAKYLKSL